jgi:hypothetical protein
MTEEVSHENRARSGHELPLLAVGVVCLLAVGAGWAKGADDDRLSFFRVSVVAVGRCSGSSACRWRSGDEHADELHYGNGHV